MAKETRRIEFFADTEFLKTADVVDAPGTRSLRVEFSGRRIKVALDGKSYIELEDSHVAGAGAVGLWTKADSVTVFDDFSYGSK